MSLVGNGHIHIDAAPEVGGYDHYELRPGGLLRTVELRFEPPLPNMDASNPYVVEVRITSRQHMHGLPVRPTVFSHWEEIAP